MGKALTERATLLAIASEWLVLADLADVQEAFTPAPELIVAPSTETKQYRPYPSGWWALNKMVVHVAANPPTRVL